MAGDKKSWSQKIQNDKSFAEGYKGLTSVKAILKKAKEDGYNLKESEITKDDVKALEAVAGGLILPGQSAQPVNKNQNAGQFLIDGTIQNEVHVDHQSAAINVEAQKKGKVNINGGVNQNINKA